MNALDIITSMGKNISLRKKLLLVVLTASNTALLLASVAVIILDRQSAKFTMQQEMKVLSSVIAQRSSAALTFYDRQLAEENLNTLSERSTVVSACIYNNAGELFAMYSAKHAQERCVQLAPQLESGFLETGYLEKQDIILDGASIGSVYITASLDEINRRLFRFVIFVSLIFVVASFIAFVLAIKLQKIITKPIDELAEASRKIHHDRSYSVRVRKVTNDEIGQLVTAFNDMLDGIEDRDAMLVDAKKNLEEIVRERTAELRDAQNELILKDRLATLGQLTATVSHELRNPLGTIRTSVFTLSNRIKNKEDSIQHIMDRIDRNIVRCDSIITELLDYSRIRALQHQKTNLAIWLKTLLGETEIPDGISVSLELDDSIETEIDRDLFRRVMVNVIDNASQAINSVENNTAKKIIIESRINNGLIELIVTDTGPGIDPDILQRVFDPLFSTKSFGIGLGLSIVRQIMVQHGGSVDIVSELNVGTRVILTLPGELMSDSFAAKNGY